jgi:hypothetical protein
MIHTSSAAVHVAYDPGARMNRVSWIWTWISEEE